MASNRRLPSGGFNCQIRRSGIKSRSKTFKTYKEAEVSSPHLAKLFGKPTNFELLCALFDQITNFRLLNAGNCFVTTSYKMVLYIK